MTLTSSWLVDEDLIDYLLVWIVLELYFTIGHLLQIQFLRSPQPGLRILWFSITSMVKGLWDVNNGQFDTAHHIFKIRRPEFLQLDIQLNLTNTIKQHPNLFFFLSKINGQIDTNQPGFISLTLSQDRPEYKLNKMLDLLPW